jgi:hypothetical protein
MVSVVSLGGTVARVDREVMKDFAEVRERKKQ